MNFITLFVAIVFAAIGVLFLMRGDLVSATAFLVGAAIIGLSQRWAMPGGNCPGCEQEQRDAGWSEGGFP